MEDDTIQTREILEAVPGLELVSAPWRRSSIALHLVVDEVDGRIITATGDTFDCRAYSRFKYGHHTQAGIYGEQLAKLLLEHPVSAMFGGEKPVVVSASAYKRLRTAAQFVADHVATRLRWANILVQEGRIHRAHLTEGDYGTMSYEERQYWMANNGLSVDTAIFDGRHVVVVDDIRITGSHERAIWNLFADLPIKSLTNLYVLELDPSLAKRDPGVEDRMNHASIKSLGDLYELMWEESYVPTARTVKFVLSRPLDALAKFLAQADSGDLRSLHMGVLDDGYYAMKTYSEGSQMVINEVARRKKAAAKRNFAGFEDRYWRDWDPQPYSGPTPGVSDEPSSSPNRPAKDRELKLPFGFKLRLSRDS